MNIAFSAILIFLLLLPGFIFYSAYRYLEKVPTEYKPFASETILCFLIAVILHLLFIFLIHKYTLYRVDFYTLLILIAGHENNVEVNLAITAILHNFKMIIAYFLIIYSSAWILGYFIRGIITSTGLDRKFKFLRFNNKWYYFFSGYDQPTQVDATYVAVLTEVAKKAYLYVGFLEHYYLDEQGNLDRIVLYGAKRRIIDKDKNPDSDLKEDRFYTIDSDYFVINYSQVKNLNIQFFEFEELPE